MTYFAFEVPSTVLQDFFHRSIFIFQDQILKLKLRCKYKHLLGEAINHATEFITTHLF